MKETPPSFRTSRRTLMTALITFLLICMLMGIACFQYYLQLQRTLKEESGGYLQEISKLLGDNASRIINDHFAMLGTVSASLKTANAATFLQLRPLVEDQRQYWQYKEIYLVDASGVAYDTAGGSISFGGKDFLRTTIVNGKPKMSSSMTVDGIDCVMFSIPVQDFAVGGIQIRALVASYELATFDQILSMTAFGGEAYAHIIERDGSVVIRSSSPNAEKAGYNILSTLSAATFDEELGFEALTREIADGHSGMAAYTIRGTRKYMAYTPLSGQDWTLLTFVPVAVVSAKSELLLHITLLLCGFIVLAFGTLTIALATSFYKHKHSLESLAFVDPITGGNTIQKFYEDAWPLLQKAADKVYALIYMNIEKFKVLNEQFGKKACDELLRGIHEGISTDLADDECMGRLSADNFCILVRFENEDALIARFAKWRSNTMAYIESIGSLWLPQNAEFGVFVIDDAALPLAHMIDRAKLSLTEATSTLRDKMRYAIFNEKVRHALLREKQLEDAMEDALAAREFTVYLQPKYDTQTERIGGAEALVRWKSPTEGMIYPDEFIPLFEKNSFVVQIDLFVFEEICRLLERWVQDGLPLIKVSVNCSRAQLRIPNFLESYRQIMQKYVFPANMLEIELTETVVFEDVAALSAVIREIHALGLGCSMDDFGSGYSSLNLIRHIPVDTLKLDKVFFRTTPEDAERTESVVGSIITMAKALHMSTVAEGVEQRAQVDMLKRLGCDSIQGYYFARPMPISAFDQLRLAERAQIEKTKLA